VHGCRGVPGGDDLERASIADLLAELAQVEEAIRAAAEAGYPRTAVWHGVRTPSWMPYAGVVPPVEMPRTGSRVRRRGRC
jgi:hypothetical protein